MGRKKTHGMSTTVEYHAFKDAKTRCTNPKCKTFADYGGRGIEFLFTSFAQFIQHIGKRPTAEHELDRIDNDGHYKVGNVRWVTSRVSSINRRKQSNNTSGYLGVMFNLEKQQWRAYIRDHETQQHLGYFASPIAAAHARDTAAKQLHGEHAVLNFPESKAA